MFRILVVCTGNICRSPTAEAVLRHLIEKNEYLRDKVEVASCGIGAWHVGELPDGRAAKIASLKGISCDGIRASKIEESDFYDFDLILAMDKSHLQHLHKIAPSNKHAQIRLFLEYAENKDLAEVVDPYYGDIEKFEYVFTLIQEASLVILQKVENILSA